MLALYWSLQGQRARRGVADEVVDGEQGADPPTRGMSGKKEVETPMRPLAGPLYFDGGLPMKKPPTKAAPGERDARPPDARHSGDADDDELPTLEGSW